MTEALGSVNIKEQISALSGQILPFFSDRLKLNREMGKVRDSEVFFFLWSKRYYYTYFSDVSSILNGWIGDKNSDIKPFSAWKATLEMEDDREPGCCCMWDIQSLQPSIHLTQNPDSVSKL